MSADDASWLHLDRRPRETLRAAVERALREAITGGALRAGTRLPSSRRLAESLGVSRGVTSEAYARLAGQGFLAARAKATPVVAEVWTASPRPDRAPAPVGRIRFDLTATTPDVTLFPANRWLAAMRAAIGQAPPRSFDYGDVRGAIELREALADYLGRVRGAVVDAERVVIVQGTAQGIDMLARVLAARGARRAVLNDPGLPSQWDRFVEAGLEVAGQPVDAEGLVVDGMHGDAVLTTPAHQFPTGAVLSGPRRRALLAWARGCGALVIEDDYDAEFRYGQESVPALQGLGPESVAYVGTASKTLMPALRLGWVVLPATLVAEAARLKNLLDAGSPTFPQRALAILLRSGEYERHLRRVRAVYRRRRDRLIAALDGHLPSLAVEGIAAGVHVLLRLPKDADDRAAAQRAERAGIRVAALSEFAQASTGRGLVLGFGRLVEEDVEPAIAALARVLG